MGEKDRLNTPLSSLYSLYSCTRRRVIQKGKKYGAARYRSRYLAHAKRALMIRQAQSDPGQSQHVFARGANDGEEIFVYFDRVEALCETQKRIILRKKSDSGTRVGGVLKDVKEDEDEGKEE